MSWPGEEEGDGAVLRIEDQASQRQGGRDGMRASQWTGSTVGLSLLVGLDVKSDFLVGVVCRTHS
jgi:hypothetical protein